MAVDTRQKRMSMMSFGQPILFLLMFETDNEVSPDDRIHMLNLYSGLYNTSNPAAGSDSGEYYYYGMYAGD